MAKKRSDLKKEGYTAKVGGHAKGHPLMMGSRGTSIGAARQKRRLPYFSPAPRGFRPSDAGKVVLDARNRTAGPIDDMTPRGSGVPHG